MIKVIRENNKIIIKGHAKYDEYGKDIVCASVSSICYTTINAIAKLKDNAIKVVDKEIMEISILTKDEIVEKLIENMMELFYSLEEDYPKNINVKEC